LATGDIRVPVIARAVASCAGLLVACLATGLAYAQPVPIAPQFGTPSPTQDPQKLQLPLRAPITLLPTTSCSTITTVAGI
jgi:hypothetical protein